MTPTPASAPLRHGYVLTTDKTVTTDGRLVLVAIISDGSPQRGDDPVTVLTIETFPPWIRHKEVLAWFRRMKKEQPWVTRQ